MTTLYKLKNIKKYYDDKKVLDIEDLTLNKGGIVGVFGPNGSGKSTLFSLLSFISEHTSGELFFKGHSSDKIDFDMKQNVVMLPQNPYLLKRTVYENVAFGLKLRNKQDNVEKKVYEALSSVGLDESFAKRKWSQLSGGEAQRVALAARLILKPDILILDEPTASVDINSAQMIKRAIILAKEKWGTTLLISSHDHSWLNQVCDRKIALFQGKVIESGNINLLFAPWIKDKDENLAKTFSDGQVLTIVSSKKKKRDAVAMINSTDINVVLEKQEGFLRGVVSSIQKHNSQNDLLVEISVAEVNLNTTLSNQQIKDNKILPGEEVWLNINTKDVCWL